MISRDFFDRPPEQVAPELLNKLIVNGGRSARIVEVEAYGGARDPASHAFRGPRPRNAVMFGPPGHLYVYFSYGVHWCVNLVCCPEGEAGAVLLRAAEAVDGLEEMRLARPTSKCDPDLLRGPGNLAKALGLTRDHNGTDLITGTQGVQLLDDGIPPPSNPAVTPRVGLTKAPETMWRFHIPDNPSVSRAGRQPRKPPGVFS